MPERDKREACTLKYLKVSVDKPAKTIGRYYYATFNLFIKIIGYIIKLSGSITIISKGLRKHSPQAGKKQEEYDCHLRYDT